MPVPEGGVASTPSEAREIAASLGRATVVKAQVHAGGRGKAGGIKLTATPEEAEAAAAALLGTSLVTAQTGPEGVPVRSVLVEEQLDVRRELYLGMLVDGAVRGVVVMASEAGGMDIEEVADTTPEKILRVAVDPALGLRPYQARTLAYRLDFAPEQVRAAASLIEGLYRVFDDNDCSLAEINPLVVTGDGRVLAADAKLAFDDDALFKHPGLEELRDPEQDDPLEERAASAGISYVKLDGDVGCMVNGAGLAMATMDVAQGRRRRAGELPRRRRQRGRGEGRAGDGDHPVRRQREDDPDQHLRRHTQVRHRLPGPDRRRRVHVPRDEAAGGPHVGHQRRRGAQAAERVGPGRDLGGRPGRGSRGAARRRVVATGRRLGAVMNGARE